MLIFNADDFGLTQIDVDRICISLDFGVIKSTTVVATHVSSEDVKKLNLKSGSFGVHINLVEGEAISGISTITDKNGFFLSKKQLFKRLLLGKVKKQDLENEVFVQFQRLIDFGLLPTHIDTHQNTHIVLPILKAIIKAGDKFGVRKIRGESSEYGWFGGEHNRVKSFVKNNYCTFWHNQIPKDWIATQKIILNAPGMGQEFASVDEAIVAWKNALERFYSPNIIYEVPCHLCLSEFEFELYNSNKFKNMVEKLNIKVGNYNDL